LSISLAGLLLPFGLGIAVSYGIYENLGNKAVPFSSFMLFTGTAMAITVENMISPHKKKKKI